MSQMSAHAIANADAQATTSTSSMRSNNARGTAWASASHLNKNAFVGFNLGVPASPLESLTSMDPKDYVWGTPSQQQQQSLFQQFMQMAFFWHMAQNASLSNGNQGQQPLPMLPFPFAPMGPMNSFPFNPVMPPFPGYAPGASQAPAAANAVPPTAPQNPAASPSSMPATSAPIDTAPLSVPPQQPTSASQLDPAGSSPDEPNHVENALDLDDAPHDCDAIESLLADAELFAGSKGMSDDCSSYDHVGSPCSLSGSDGSTATADAFFQGSDSDSPASVTGDVTLYPPTDLALSDAELDAVMLGLANNSNFTDLDMDDYAFIGLDAPSASATAKPDCTNKTQKQSTKDKAAKKRKAAICKPAGAAKADKRSKGQAKQAAVAVADAIQSVTDLLGAKMH